MFWPNSTTYTQVPCVSEAQTCLAQVQDGGGVEAPSWEEAATGVKPPPSSEEADQTDFERGWQNYAFTFLETNFLEDVVKPKSDKSRLAVLLSQGDGAGSAWLRAVPSEKAFELSPLRLQVAVRRRLRWPLPLSKGVCCRSCQKDLDVLGDRAAACPTAGRLAKRARPVEKSWARVLREGGARVRENVELRETTLAAVDPNDGRRVEIVASGLPLSQGVPLAVDATVVSPLHADGTPFARAHFHRGSTFHRAEKSKRDTYPELVGSSVLRLMTVACEVGGRFNTEAKTLVTQLAEAKARSEVRVLRSSATRAWQNRWFTLLSVSVQNAVASTLVNEGTSFAISDGLAPPAVDVCLGV